MNNFGFLQDLERGHLLEDLIAAQQGKEGMIHMQPMDVMPRPNPVSEWWGGVKERAGNPMGGVLDMLSQAYGYSGTPEMQQAFRQVPAALPEGLPVGMGGFPVMGGMTVFHGTPHQWLPEPEFPQGRPRLDKLGTGEGAQVYGHGIYFAENPRVAEGYQAQLSKPKAIVDGVEIPYDPNSYNPRDHAIGMVGYKGNEGAKKFIEDTIKNGEGANPDWWLEVRSEVDKLEGSAVRVDEGNTYKLDLPDEQVPNLLDWDKPLAYQPKMLDKVAPIFGEKVPNQIGVVKTKSGRVIDIGSMSGREALKEAERYAGERLMLHADEGRAIRRQIKDIIGDDKIVNIPNREVVKIIAPDKQKEIDRLFDQMDKLNAVALDPPKAATAAFAGAGIPGLSYLDQGSRVAGDGTRNFVIWDQNILNRMVPQ